MKSKVFKPAKPPFSKYKKEVFTNASKVTDFIYQIGESPILRKSSKEVSLNKIKSSAMRAKIKYLKKCLENYKRLTGHGRGIAGVQVGIPERFAVVYTTLDKTKMEIIINPKITKQAKTLLKYPELCMSANPVIVPLARPAWIEFNYYDERGNPKYWRMKDSTSLGKMLNRVFQHEIDHMEGIVNVDLIKSPKELILVSDPEFYKKAKFEKNPH